ncbi:MAG: DUF4231 domain-containing protein [Symploca sp. SIO2C1]|nr:DUF4231 domain-containing protein [Symploca sp. SIO2C1]
MTDSQTVVEPLSLEPEKQPSFVTSSGFLLFLKMLQSLGLAALIFCALATVLIPGEYNRFILYDAGLFAGIIFLFLLNNQFADLTKSSSFDLKRKAGLYVNLMPKKDTSDGSPDGLVESREKALEYCHNLIQDYVKVRQTSRNLYYIFQLSTIVLSGITPIFVLVDKQIDVPYLQWLPVICPAVAAVVTSVATSFPFQERWVNANRVVEKLEAEQEKFILGITPPYRAFMIEQNDDERGKKMKLSIENFIIEVNKIHLQQVETPSAKTEGNEPAGNSRSSGN